MYRQMDDKTKGIIEITIAAILFGIIPLIVKLSSLSAYTLSSGRIIIATIFIGAWLGFKKKKIDFIKKDRVKFILFGVLHALIILFSFIAIKTINVAIASILIYAGAIYLVGLSAIFLKEKIERTTIFALFLCLIGFITLFWTNQFGGNLIGYLAGLLAGIFVAVVYLIGKILSKNYDKKSMTFIQNLIALPFVIPLFFMEKFEINVINMTVLIFLGVFCTAVPFILLYSGMKKVKGQKAGLLLMLELIIPVVLSLLLLKEIPSYREWIGGGLILISYLIVGFSKSNEK